MAVGLIQPDRDGIRIAIERQIVAARSDVANLRDQTAPDLVLDAGVVLRRVRLLRVVLDELGSLLDGEAGALREQLLHGGTEGRHRADVDAGEVRVNAERRAAIEGRG